MNHHHPRQLSLVPMIILVGTVAFLLASSTFGTSAGGAKLQLPSCVSNNILTRGVARLFRRKPQEMSALEAELQEVVTREKQIAHIDTFNMADPQFLTLLLDKQSRLLDIVTQNSLENIPSEQELATMRDERLKQWLNVITCSAMPVNANANANAVAASADEDEQQVETALEPLADVLAAVNINARNNVPEKYDQSVLEMKLWKGDQQEKKTWLDKLKRKYRKMKAENKQQNQLAKMAKKELKAEMEADIRRKGTLGGEFKRNWHKNAWTAVPKLFASLIERSHCIGFFKLLKSVRKMWLKFRGNEAKLAELKLKEDAAEYRKQGELLFNMFLSLHGISPHFITPFDVQQLIVHNPNPADRVQQIKFVLDTLEKFSLSTLLVPLRDQRSNGIPLLPLLTNYYSETLSMLGVIQALLTDKALLLALAEEYKNAANADDEVNADGSAAPFRRQKRGVLTDQAFRSVTYPLLLTLAILQPVYGIAILVGYAAVDWCWA